MGFPKRRLIQTTTSYTTVETSKEKQEPNIQIGFPVRKMIDESIVDVNMKSAVQTEVIIDTGKLPDNNEPCNKEIHELQSDGNGIYHEDVKEQIIAENRSNIMFERLNPESAIIDQAEENRKNDKTKYVPTIPTDPLDKSPEIMALRNMPIEELVFHKFTEYELNNLPFKLVSGILKHRHRAFKQKFGEKAFAWENVYDYGDKKPELIRKILASNLKD